MVVSGLLLLSWPSLRQLRVTSLLSTVAQRIRSTLYIHMVPDGLNMEKTNNTLPCKPDVHHLVMSVYGATSSAFPGLDVRVVLSNITNCDTHPPNISHLKHGYDAVFHHADNGSQSVLESYLQKYFPTDSPVSWHTIKDTDLVSCPENDILQVNPKFDAFKTYDNVVLGGTFDHIHTGHKLLLTESCLRCEKSITIGVTDGAMNASKFTCQL